MNIVIYFREKYSQSLSSVSTHLLLPLKWNESSKSVTVLLEKRKVSSITVTILLKVGWNSENCPQHVLSYVWKFNGTSGKCPHKALRFYWNLQGKYARVYLADFAHPMICCSLSTNLRHVFFIRARTLI